MSAKKRTSARLQQKARSIQAASGGRISYASALAMARASAGPDPKIELFAEINQISYARAAQEFNPVTGEPKYLDIDFDTFVESDLACEEWGDRRGLVTGERNRCLHAFGDQWGERCINAVGDNDRRTKCSAQKDIWKVANHFSYFAIPEEDDIDESLAAISMHPYLKWDDPKVHAELREMSRLFGLRYRIGFAEDQHYGHSPRPGWTTVPIILWNPHLISLLPGTEQLDPPSLAVSVWLSTGDLTFLSGLLGHPEAFSSSFSFPSDSERIRDQLARSRSGNATLIPDTTASDIAVMLHRSARRVELPDTDDGVLRAFGEALILEGKAPFSKEHSLNAGRISIQVGSIDPEELRQAVDTVEQRTGVRAELVGLQHHISAHTEEYPQVVSLSEVGERREDANLGLHGPTKIVRQVISEMMHGPVEGAFAELDRIVELRRRFSDALRGAPIPGGVIA